MMTQSTRSGISVAAAVLLVIGIFLQKTIDPLRHQFEPKIANVNSAVNQLPVEFALGAAIGFREAIAGMLWVRTDEFFHEGDYDAIIPMVRIITWLDPHNTDVYETGAWHMDYNFTDQAQRSDRRYIPLALSLLKEGIANNAGNSGMYADLAFTHYYRKIGDYKSAVEWFEKGQALSQDPAHKDDWDVTAVGHGLAHAYTADGEIDKAIAEWELCEAEHLRRADIGRADEIAAQDKAARTLLDSGQIDQAIADWQALLIDELRRDTAASSTDVINMAGARAAFKNLKETILRQKWRKIMTQPPINVDFRPTVTRIAPAVLVITGNASFIGSNNFVLETGAHTWGPQDGARFEIRLEDADYKYPGEGTFTLNSATEKSVTIMQDSFPVTKGAFKKKIDMSTDTGGSNPIYSFSAPKYKLVMWFNPGSEQDNPPNIADRIGYSGEGMTDNPELVDDSGKVPGCYGKPVPGLRLIKRVIYLTRDQVMGLVPTSQPGGVKLN